ncbi:ABC transporter substrate-binding protein [Pseudoalteromonas atlantica]|uniref:ABC transporter substrate-binding protein n=1 Tax=Pseudoalteromonas atlantica TaxID=288 RepID=UPI003736DCF9
MIKRWNKNNTALLLLWTSGAFANTTDNISEITWLQSDTPPFHLNKSELTPYGGLCDNLVEQLIEHLPSLKHTRVVMPQKRIGKNLDEGENACFPCMIYLKEDTARATYSVPTAVYPPFSIITTANNATKINNKHGQPVQLVNLLIDPEFVFGQSAARKFTPKLNEIAKNTQIYNSASLSWSSENESKTVISRINHGYIDYTIDYPFMADYFNRENEHNTIVSLNFEANQAPFVMGAIGCSSSAPNEFGRKAIEKINKVLTQKVLPSKAYQRSQLFWLENSFTNFNQIYQQNILAKPPAKTPQ